MLVQKLGHNPILSALDSLITALSWGIWVGLLGDFVIGSPNDPFGFGKWSWNPFYDLMYLRIGGPFLYGNHVITALFILSVPLYFCIKEGYSAMPKWLTCMFATVFLHEISLQTFGYLAYGMLVTRQIINSYILILGLFALAAFVFGNKFKRKRLYLIALVCVLSSFVAMSAYAIFNYHPLTLGTFAPGPQLYSFFPNLFENILWILPVSIWYLPKKWFE